MSDSSALFEELLPPADRVVMGVDDTSGKGVIADVGDGMREVSSGRRLAPDLGLPSFMELEWKMMMEARLTIATASPAIKMLEMNCPRELPRCSIFEEYI